MDYSVTHNEYSRSSVPVIISHLATTQAAARNGTIPGSPSPALNEAQMDQFIDTGIRMQAIEGLSPNEV